MNIKNTTFSEKVPKSNRYSVETEIKPTPLRHIYMTTTSFPGSVQGLQNCGGIKLVVIDFNNQKTK
jgi:hypothetical protein